MPVRQKPAADDAHGGQPPAPPPATPAAPAPAPGPGEPQTFTLSDGRIVTMAKPKAARSLFIFKCLGPGNCRNEMLILSYQALFHVTHIDGQPIAVPQTELQVEAIEQRLGDDGFNDVLALYLEHFMTAKEDIRPLSITPSAGKS